MSAAPLRGLGADAEAVDLLDQAMQNPVGRPSETTHIVRNKENHGGRRDKALRRLRKDAPELHAGVLAVTLVRSLRRLRQARGPRYLGNNVYATMPWYR